MTNVKDVKELKTLSKADLISNIAKCREELFRLKMKSHTTGLDKPHLFKDLKSNQARMTMLLNEMSRGNK